MFCNLKIITFVYWENFLKIQGNTFPIKASKEHACGFCLEDWEFILQIPSIIIFASWAQAAISFFLFFFQAGISDLYYDYNYVSLSLCIFLRCSSARTSFWESVSNHTNFHFHNLSVKHWQ